MSYQDDHEGVEQILNEAYGHHDIKAVVKLQALLTASNKRTVEMVLDEMTRLFTPSTGTRGQGGLPLPGSVKDWELHITKEGWESYKKMALNKLKEQS